MEALSSHPQGLFLGTLGFKEHILKTTILSEHLLWEEIKILNDSNVVKNVCVYIYILYNGERLERYI